MRAEIGQIAVDAAYEELGAPGCAYQAPGGGSPLTGITVMLTRLDGTVGFEGRAIATRETIAVRASEATPEKDGVFTVPVKNSAGVVIGSNTFQVIADPEQLDPLRLEWTCAVAKTS